MAVNNERKNEEILCAVTAVHDEENAKVHSY
jgi:hypothetical protein